MEEAPVAVSTIVGGRGTELDTARGRTDHGLEEDQITGNRGRPVKGSNGIIGWMHDHEAADKKVSGITFVFNCYVIYFVAGVCITSSSFVISLASVTINDRYTVRYNRRI